MCGPERIDPSIVDQNIDVGISEFDRPFRHVACAGCISKVRRNKICLASCPANFVDRVLPALGIPAHDQDMDAKVRQFLGRRTTDSARSSSDKGGGSVSCHPQLLKRNLLPLDSHGRRAGSKSIIFVEDNGLYLPVRVDGRDARLLKGTDAESEEAQEHANSSSLAPYA